jgi:hypothetical protein
MRAARSVVLALLVVLGTPGCGGARDEARASDPTDRTAAARTEPAPAGTDPEAAAEPAPPLHAVGSTSSTRVEAETGASRPPDWSVLLDVEQPKRSTHAW